MRADDRALIALDANLCVPHRNLEGEIPLLPLRGSHRPGSINRKRAHRQQVAFTGKHHSRDLLHEVWRALGDQGWTSASGAGCFRHRNLMQVGESQIHDLAVTSYNLWPPLTV